MNKLKSKKIILAILVILVLGIIGITFLDFKPFKDFRENLSSLVNGDVNPFAVIDDYINPIAKVVDETYSISPGDLHGSGHYIVYKIKSVNAEDDYMYHCDFYVRGKLRESSHITFSLDSINRGILITKKFEILSNDVYIKENGYYNLEDFKILIYE